MAKPIKLKDRQSNEILPLTRATLVEMNSGVSLQTAYDGINLTHYTKDEINAAGYINSYTETDPTVPSYVKEITESDITYWNGKQNELVSGSNIKTINNESVLGSGNITAVSLEYLEENYVHKPDVIYQYETGMTQIYGQTSGTISSTWDLTNLDLSPYKYIKAFIKGSDNTNSDTNLTSPIIVTIPLDAGIIAGGATYFTGSGISAGANNHNRMWISFCAVDDTKTKFQLIRTISLYGTTGTDASNSGRYLYRIEGWYDDQEAETGGNLPYTELDPTVPSYVKNITQTEITMWNSYGNLDKIPQITTTSASSLTIDPYKFYDLGTVSQAITIAFNTTAEITGYANEYMIRFVAGNGCQITLPQAVVYNNGQAPVYVSGRTYEINVINNCAVVGEFYTAS